MTRFFMKRNTRLGLEGKEVVSFYFLLLIFLAAACFVMAVYLWEESERKRKKVRERGEIGKKETYHKIVFILSSFVFIFFLRIVTLTFCKENIERLSEENICFCNKFLFSYCYLPRRWNLATKRLRQRTLMHLLRKQ